MAESECYILEGLQNSGCYIMAPDVGGTGTWFGYRPKRDICLPETPLESAKLTPSSPEYVVPCPKYVSIHACSWISSYGPPSRRPPSALGAFTSRVSLLMTKFDAEPGEPPQYMGPGNAKHTADLLESV